MNDSFKIIENFISDEDSKKIICFFRKRLLLNPDKLGIYPSEIGVGEDKSNFIYDGVVIENSEESIFINRLLIDIIQKIIKESEKLFNEEMKLFHICYHSFLPGGEIGLHSDSTDLYGNPTGINGEQEPQEFSALLYFNECGKDYTGGEIEFPNQKIIISPKTGQLVIFKGNHEYAHSINTVVSGIRDSLVLFFSRKNNNSTTPFTSIIPNKDDIIN